MKKEKRKSRNRQRVEIRKLGKWLSNYDVEDLLDRILDTFPQVVVGPPRAFDPWTVNDMIKSGIVGLYLKKDQLSLEIKNGS